MGVATGALVGWRTFLFTTDDAYIAFRYVANSRAGWGLVWNPPPFQPVEGYTSFLWVMLLKLVWWLTDLEPPQTANHLSLLAGCASLLVGLAFLLRMRLPAALCRYRPALIAIAAAGTLSNRTFLTWLSSGLETALFNLCLTWWAYEGLTHAKRRPVAWPLRLCTAATLCALTRPDGLLVVGATLLLLGVSRALDKRSSNEPWFIRLTVGLLPTSRLRLLYLSPLLLIAAHLAWRFSFYGYCLPNTYYAKAIEAWPEAGVRYAASFVVEYGLWVWVALAVTALVVSVWRSGTSTLGQFAAAVCPLIVVGTLVAHVGYYIVRIGGDHFEYRVLSHLVVLSWVSAVWLLAKITASPWKVLTGLVVLLLFSLPVQWVHWSETRHLDTRKETRDMVVPIAHRFPPSCRTLVGSWDSWQAWLHQRLVGTRHQAHKVYGEFRIAQLPSRQEGARIRWQPSRPVMARGSVGYLGWVVPEVAIIDLFGLNDQVVARTEISPVDMRIMAHERKPPDGYVECFRPNFNLRSRVNWDGSAIPPSRDGGLHLFPRRAALALTDEVIRDCEKRFQEDPGHAGDSLRSK